MIVTRTPRRHRTGPARHLVATLLALAVAVLAAPAFAQNPFETVLRVNEGIITRYEIAQRTALMRVLRMPETSTAAAEQALIEDRLKLGAAREADLLPTQEDIGFGVEDFAARAGISVEEFLLALDDVGIAPETVRDFVATSIGWGEVLRERFTAQARPSEAEIDRAMTLGTPSSRARVLLSEIVLPLEPGLEQATQERAAAIAQLTSFDAFAAAARRFSIGPTRADGGRLDWRPISSLPPQVAGRFLSLGPGDVTEPIVLGNTLALFQLRALEDAEPRIGDNAQLDYAVLRLVGEETAPGILATWRSRADGCADLFTIHPGADEARLQRREAERSALSAALRSVLDGLDPGEAAALPGSGAPGEVVMLCARSAIREEDVSREEVAQQLFARRLEALGDSFLAQLRADARIERLQ